MRSRTHAIFAALVAIASAPPVDAQVIQGRLVEIRSEAPLAAATVVLLDRGGAARFMVESDSAGSFVVAAPEAGEYALRIVHIAIGESTTTFFQVHPAEHLELVIRLEPEVTALTPVRVVARRVISPHAEFNRRRVWGERNGTGTFITREELERAASSTVTNLLAHIPGAPLVYDSQGRPHLGITGRRDHSCAAMMLLNGVQVELPPSFSLDDFIRPDQLDGIEVYVTRSELPPELARLDLCKVVAFWTRTGLGEEREWSWIRVGIGTAMMTGLLGWILLR